jgi:hypothetical protein
MSRQIVRAAGVIGVVILWRLAYKAITEAREARSEPVVVPESQGDDIPDRLATFQRRRLEMEIEQRKVKARSGHVSVTYATPVLPVTIAALAFAGAFATIYALMHPIGSIAWPAAALGISLAATTWVYARLRR